MKNEQFKELLQRMDKANWAMFGGDKIRALDQIEKAIDDIGRHTTAMAQTTFRRNFGVESAHADESWERTHKAILWMNGLCDKMGLPEAKYPTERAEAEAFLARETHEKFQADLARRPDRPMPSPA